MNHMLWFYGISILINIIDQLYPNLVIMTANTNFYGLKGLSIAVLHNKMSEFTYKRMCLNVNHFKMSEFTYRHSAPKFPYKRMRLYVNQFKNKNPQKTHKFAYKPMRL